VHACAGLAARDQLCSLVSDYVKVPFVLRPLWRPPCCPAPWLQIVHTYIFKDMCPVCVCMWSVCVCVCVCVHNFTYTYAALMQVTSALYVCMSVCVSVCTSVLHRAKRRRRQPTRMPTPTHKPRGRPRRFLRTRIAVLQMCKASPAVGVCVCACVCVCKHTHIRLGVLCRLGM
jgi:hypothetical protein